MKTESPDSLDSSAAATTPVGLKGELIPAMVFHPVDCIAEEAIARGWSFADFCALVKPDDPARANAEYSLYALREPDILLGDDGAAELARVFGTSAEIWLNMERSYRQHEQARTVLGPHVDEWFGMNDEVDP